MMSPSLRRLMVRSGSGSSSLPGETIRRSTLPIGAPAGHVTGGKAPCASATGSQSQEEAGKSQAQSSMISCGEKLNRALKQPEPQCR